jgi:hypothetical protein
MPHDAIVAVPDVLAEIELLHGKNALRPQYHEDERAIA